MNLLQGIPAILRQRKLAVFGLLIFAIIPPAQGVDEVLLKSGNRVNGTIVAQSKDQVVMRVGEGTVVLSKRAIRRIYDGITANRPVSEMLAEDELPPWWIPLADLYSEDWVTTLKNVEPTVIKTGSFKNVPYLSFRANANYELNIYGDPDKPAAIEIGHYSKTVPRPDVITHCREFLVSYLTDLDQIKALYDLDTDGGTRTEGGLTIRVSPPREADAYGGWWLLVFDEKRLSAARTRTVEEFRRTSASYVDIVRAATENQTAWQKWELTDALQRLIPSENIQIR